MARITKVSLEMALRMADSRTAQLGRLMALGAPQIIIDEQRRMIADAQALVAAAQAGDKDEPV